MSKNFVPLCNKYYGCDKESYKLYSTDKGKVDFVECGSCGLIWRDLDSCNEERKYDESYFLRMTYSSKREHRINKAELLLSVLEEFTSPGTFLEIGPALGYNMEAAKRRGWDVEGIDISDYVVQMSKSIGLRIIKGDLFHTKELSGGYDAIFMKHLLEHYRNPFAALQNVRNLLSKDGLVQIIVPNSKYIRARKLRDKCKFYSYEKNGVEHYVYFNNDSLRKILEFTGFELVQKGLPLNVKGDNSIKSITDRFLRKSMALVNLDQEIFAIARKLD